MSTNTTRMSIDIPIKDHKRLKMMATALGLTLREFVVDCIHEKIYPPKTPNKKTRQAMSQARSKKTAKAKDFDDLCNKLGL